MNAEEQTRMLKEALNEVLQEKKDQLPLDCAFQTINDGGRISFRLTGRVNVHENIDLSDSELNKALNESDTEVIKNIVNDAYKDVAEKILANLKQLCSHDFTSSQKSKSAVPEGTVSSDSEDEPEEESSEEDAGSEA
jgi:DNA-binding protein YbaB